MDRLKELSLCEGLFKSERLNELNSDRGRRYLKLRSLNRSVFLKKFLVEHGVDAEKLKAQEQLPAAFNLDVDIEQIDKFIRREYEQERSVRKGKEEELFNELYKLKVFDWGGLHQNSLERTIVDNYIKRISSFEGIEDAIENELQSSLRGYVFCSWYNHWTSILIEDIFKEHRRILPALGLIPKVDFFIDDIPFDLKVTYLPEGYIARLRMDRGLRPELTLLKQSARIKQLPIDPSLPAGKQLENLWLKHEEFSKEEPLISELRHFRNDIVADVRSDPTDLIRWLYENQGIRRFDASNRFFIVLVNTQNFFEGWKMKRSLSLLRRETNNFLDKNLPIGRNCDFLWKSRSYKVKGDVLLITN